MQHTRYKVKDSCHHLTMSMELPIPHPKHTHTHTTYPKSDQIEWNVPIILQWNLIITRSLGPWKLPCYIRFLITCISGLKKNTKGWDQQNDLVIRGFCYIRPLYNEVPLYYFFHLWTVPNSPVNLTVVSILSCAGEVSWEFPEGEFDYFTVTYTPDHGAALNEETIWPQENDTSRTYRLIGLLPDTQYNITIVTVTGDVEEVQSEPSTISFSTGESLKFGIKLSHWGQFYFQNIFQILDPWCGNPWSSYFKLNWDGMCCDSRWWCRVTTKHTMYPQIHSILGIKTSLLQQVMT